jgi:hypothetical protein
MPGAKNRPNSIATYLGCILGGLGLVVAGFFAGLQFQWYNGAPPPADVAGTYEWQWAGENWFGRITLSDHNRISQAKVGVLKKAYAPNGSARFEIQDEVMQLVDGTYEPKGESKVAIEMLVKKKVRGEHPELQQTIVGILEKRHCLVGQVKYQDYLTGKSYFGDMILVNYSSPLGEEIEAWYTETK